ncbi:hypothetical protein Tco_0122137 [Tanacetum coccineum]
MSQSLATKELTMTVADFRGIFQLPQAIENNNVGFVAALTFSQMVPFFLKDLGFSQPLRSPSNFMSKGLTQPWQTLCVHYSLTHTPKLIPYLRFTKMIVDHYMTEHPNILKRVHDNYHRVENDDLVKNIFNSRKNKDGAGMKILDWMLKEEMKLTDHYKMYDAVFHVDVPATQSQPIESIQGTHRTTSAPRTPKLEVTKGEYSAQRKPTVIRFRLTSRRQDPKTPIPKSS